MYEKKRCLTNGTLFLLNNAFLYNKEVASIFYQNKQYYKNIEIKIYINY